MVQKIATKIEGMIQALIKGILRFSGSPVYLGIT